MTSSFTPRNRLNKQGDGDNTNVWGDVLNAAGGSDLIDVALDGWNALALSSGGATLTSANGLTDQARYRTQKFTGTGPMTVTIPSVEKWYSVWNACTGILTVTTGSGVSATFQPGEKCIIICDATNVYRVQPVDFQGQQITSVADPTTPQGVATKAYADALAFTANAGILPGQVGNAGNFLTTNGTAASWKHIASTDLSDFNTNILGVQVALAVAL